MDRLDPITVVPVRRDEADPGARRPAELVLSTAELAECTCPEFCERDHANE